MVTKSVSHFSDPTLSLMHITSTSIVPRHIQTHQSRRHRTQSILTRCTSLIATKRSKARTPRSPSKSSFGNVPHRHHAPVSTMLKKRRREGEKRLEKLEVLKEMLPDLDLFKEGVEKLRGCYGFEQVYGGMNGVSRVWAWFFLLRALS